MKTERLASAALLVTALFIACCSGTEEHAAAPGSAKPAGPSGPTASAPVTPPAQADLPTQEQADQEAQQKIDEKNADAEMEKLKKEMEGGG
jgi:hypothetical protein